LLEESSPRVQCTQVASGRSERHRRDAEEASMKRLNVLISGASVAGPTLAYWLARHGHRPTVVERASGPRPGGQAVDLRGSARQVAERMGVLDAIRAAHTGVTGMAFVDSSGARVASMPADLLGDSGGIIAEIEILRGDLVAILHQATRDCGEHIFDDSITGLESTAAGVAVTFERSAPRVFDVVIGADGLHSNVRRLAFGKRPEMVRDLGCSVAVFPTATTVDLGGWHLLHSVPGDGRTCGRAVGLYPTLVPGEARAMFYFGGPRLTVDRRDVPGQQRALAQAFEGVGWVASQVLASMSGARDFYFDRVMQVQLDSWSRGRVALLGDAAHCASPLSGNGTSMAMVGAYVLAGELADSPDDVSGALRRYEAQMREYVGLCQRVADEGVSGLLPRSRTRAWVRDFGIRMLPYLPWRGMFFGHIQRIANLVKLKDYRPAVAA
jgi:2-polyprenyl-6-methoxyphenol hydroxylase-like FAD-dependent oxidoreductase